MQDVQARMHVIMQNVIVRIQDVQGNVRRQDVIFALIPFHNYR
jgi:hypothetical protein